MATGVGRRCGAAMRRERAHEGITGTAAHQDAGLDRMLGTRACSSMLARRRSKRRAVGKEEVSCLAANMLRRDTPV